MLLEHMEDTERAPAVDSSRYHERDWEEGEKRGGMVWTDVGSGSQSWQPVGIRDFILNCYQVHNNGGEHRIYNSIRYKVTGVMERQMDILHSIQHPASELVVVQQRKKIPRQLSLT